MPLTAYDSYSVQKLYSSPTSEVGTVGGVTVAVAAIVGVVVVV